MQAERIRAYLSSACDLQVYETLPSTNAQALALARGGAGQGTAVISGSQTAGRGRRGRGFFSPEGGLYLSLVVDSLGTSPGGLTTLAAVAAALAIAELTGQRILFKWVNDLLLDGLKVGGILCEGVLIDNRLEKTVIGIGVNTGPAAFPPELSGIAGTLTQQGEAINRERLAAGIINRILAGLPRLPAHLAEYRARCLTLGRQVAFEQQGRVLTGYARDVDEDGALIVRLEEKDIRLLAGDVSLIKNK